MAEAAVQQLRPTRICEMPISGRVDSVKTFEGKTYTRVTCPAKDAFSMPSVFEVRSLRKFAEIGQEFNSKQVSVSGYIRDYQYPDKKTGEMRPGQDNNVYFELIEN
ncbi:MAG: hypothetical protein Q8K17_04155 [Pseudohongiella sp.]|nr:hypothetical protein [Pseudohongiella sp.]MDP2092174.1 hypothetical protein [Pseudohongiella sp.]MDP2284316.1 hypothetical protein [Pseudohongiella sp.]